MIEELDLLKKDWKKSESAFQQITEVDIYKMIHKKSSSIVKWILIISVLEVVLWTSVNVFFNTDDYLRKIHSEHLIDYFRYLTIFNYVIIGIFIYFFYINYKNISTTNSTKQLMKDILRTRKTVKYYVWYNLVMIVLSSIAGFILAFSINPKMEQITHNFKAMAITICILVVFLVVFVGVFWLFYYLIYGTLLRKLFKNYNELKKIDL
jgi:Na+/proline symporter